MAAPTRRPRAARRRHDRARNQAAGPAGYARGGPRNPTTGMGTGLDKSISTYYTPTLFWTSRPLETLCVESWAARNFVDIPVDDMFVRWREWNGDPDHCAAMRAAETRHRVTDKLSRALKAARQYGTGLVVIVTAEDAPEAPLRPERIRPGDLLNLLAVHRYEASVSARQRDPMAPDYGAPEFYDIYPTWGGHLRAHRSRVIRFDGITPNTDSGFAGYDQDWGVPALTPILLALLEDQTVVTAIAHLTQEASIPVLKVSDLRAALSGQLSGDDPDAPDADQIGDNFNRLKSVFRVAMLDKEDEDFERVAVQFAGLPDLLDRFDKRVAAAAKIPLTRWMGQSPAGLNATGDSDLRNYVITLEADRQRTLDRCLPVLDAVVARSAGLAEAPDYQFGSLLELSEQDKAAAAKTKVEAAALGVTSFLWSEEEARGMLGGDPVFGALEGPGPVPLADEAAAGPAG